MNSQLAGEAVALRFFAFTRQAFIIAVVDVDCIDRRNLCR